MKWTVALILSIALQGCGLFVKKPELPVIAPQKVTIDQYLLEPCPNIDVEPDSSSFESLLVVHADLLTLYVNCANKQKAGVNLIKQFGNLK